MDFITCWSPLSGFLVYLQAYLKSESFLRCSWELVDLHVAVPYRGIPVQIIVWTYLLWVSWQKTCIYVVWIPCWTSVVVIGAYLWDAPFSDKPRCWERAYNWKQDNLLTGLTPSIGDLVQLNGVSPFLSANLRNLYGCAVWTWVLSWQSSPSS